MFDAKTYKDKNGKPLSKVDCLIIEYSKCHKDITVMTNDGLIDTTIKKLVGNTLTFFELIH